MTITIEEIEKSVSGVRLDLNDRSLTRADIELVCTFLNEHPKITQLDLSGNSIGDEGAIKLAQIPTLKSLDLSNNLIGADGIVELASNTVLEFINISENVIDKTTELTREQRAAWQVLKDMPCPVSHRLSQYVVNNTLDLGDKSIASIDFRVVASFLAANPQITGLDLSNNELDSEVVEALVAVPPLESLVIDNCGIVDNLLMILVKHTSLTSLSLCNNSISAQGIQYLTLIPNLRLLDLMDNNEWDGDDAGIVYLAMMNPNLTSLRVECAKRNGSG